MLGFAAYACVFLFFRYLDGEMPYFLTNERRNVE